MNVDYELLKESDLEELLALYLDSNFILGYGEIEEAKKDTRFALVKYESVHKEKKAKGEVIDEWCRVTLHKVFNDEVEPDSYVKVDYDKQAGFFPSPVDDDEDEE